jgi:abhydrolase domain-containing protein 6
MTRRKWRTGVIRTVRGTIGHSVRETLARLTQPTLLFMGEHDRIVSFEESWEAARMAPAVQFVPVPYCGHAPHQERPRYVNRRVIRFLKQGAARQPIRA